MAASPTGLALDAAGAVAAGQLLDLGHGDVVVVAAEGGLEGGSLNETLVVEGLQTQHQLAESDNLCHDQNLSCYKLYAYRLKSAPNHSPPSF